MLWSEVFPNEEQIVAAIGIDFEPEKDEFICLEEIVEIYRMELA